MAIAVLSHDPLVWSDEAFATRAECLELAAIGSDWELIRGLGAEPKHDETGFSWELPRGVEPAVDAMALSMEAAVGVPDALGQTLRFRRYSMGESHSPHLDTYGFHGLTLVATAMLCLEAPVDGGETRFPDAAAGPLLVRPVAGRLVVWANHGRDGRPIARSVHDAAPVYLGQKTTLTLFFYRADPTFDLLGG